jgi:hypothetical protein
MLVESGLYFPQSRIVIDDLIIGYRRILCSLLDCLRMLR